MVVLYVLFFGALKHNFISVSLEDQVSLKTQPTETTNYYNNHISQCIKTVRFGCLIIMHSWFRIF